MTAESEQEFINSCEEIVAEYIKDNAVNWVLPAEQILKGEYKPETEEELICTLREANKAIKMCARDNKELYKEYCYRLFKTTQGSFYISRGLEVKDIHKSEW